MNLDYAVKEPNSLWITYNQQKTECYEHEQEKCLIKFSDLKICMSGFLLVTELPMNVYGRPRWTKKKRKIWTRVHLHMTDHAGPRRRYECNPGTKLWHPPTFVT